MKFTAKEIKNTPYKTISLEEHFKNIKDYMYEECDVLEVYNFEILLEEENLILFAIRNNYRADIYTLNLKTFVGEKIGEIGTNNLFEGDSLYIRAINIDKIFFEYRINDEENIDGLYSISKAKIDFKFKTSNKYEYLYLTDKYFLMSEDSLIWNDSKEEWVYDFGKDNLYLYDREEDKKYKIFDRKLKVTYHTSSNHFVHKWDNVDYFLNFPFNMDPEDLESLLDGPKRFEVLNESKEISFISLDLFVQNVKDESAIQFETLYSWGKESVIRPYFYQTYTLETLIFSIYDLKEMTIKVLNPIIKDGKAEIKMIASANYSNLKTCRNIFYIGDKTIVAKRDQITRILTDENKLLEHKSRETLIGADSYGYLLWGWDEDKDGNNYREYMKILDIEKKEVTILHDYYLDLKLNKILIMV